MASAPGRAWRWFRDGPVAAVPDAPGDVAGWPALAAVERAGGHRVRCRTLPEDDLAQLQSFTAEHLGVNLEREAVARLVAAEWVALAQTCPGAGPVEPQALTLGALFAAEGAEREVLLAEAQAPGPWPASSEARASLIRVGDARAVAVVTARTNWLPRPPMPPSFYGVDRPPALGDVDPIHRPNGWRHHLGVLRAAPTGWRIDAWFALLHHFGPLALVYDLGAADEPLLLGAVADTPFAEALSRTLAEKLVLEGAGPDDSPVVAALIAALGLDAADLRLFREGRDWLAGEVELDRPAVRAALVEPIRGGVIAGRDVAPLLARAARVGGSALLARLRDELMRDGTVSAGEWEALSPAVGVG